MRPLATPQARSATAATSRATGITAVALLPSALMAAAAPQLMEELAFGSAGLGLAIAAYRASAAATSVWLGRAADRVGATRALRLAGAIAALTSVGVALTAHTLWALVVWMLVGGWAHALGHPGANRLLTNRVPPHRLGAAFGLKQSASPLGSMLAGLSVPLIAVTFGWRWTYVAAALLAVIMVLAVGRVPARRSVAAERERASREPLGDKHIVVSLAVAFGMATATSSVTITFYVDAAVRAGSSASFAGTMFAVSSVGAIAIRILSGALTDRLRSGHLRVCAALLVAGAIGLVLLASQARAAMTLGIVLAMGGCYGFHAVYWSALVRRYPSAPGRITGAVGPGGLVGATVSPVLFGVLAEAAGFTVAWGLFACVAVVAATAMLAVDRRLPPVPAA